ncbi:MAG: glycine--tRNA ligase subunit beta, partial [Thermodesulfobacteriota bacterium]
MSTLLIEIGTEEIPAGYIQPALAGFEALLLKKLDDARIGHGPSRVYGTPNRLAVMVDAVGAHQESITTEVVGPPEKVGFDADGNPTVAAEKFAEKVGVPVTEIQVKETEKGRYLYAEKTEAARSTAEILAEAGPEVIRNIPFPKTMKWGELRVLFTRPIHSIIALLGEDVIPFAYGDIHTGNQTAGHRFMYRDRVTIQEPEAYVDKLRAASVLVDLKERKTAVEKALHEVARTVDGEILTDPELVDTVTNLVEYPVVTAGRFDTGFLEVPDEVLITAMREHQKYFAVVDPEGKLKPAFLVVNNTRAKDMDLVTTGHERVLRARLSDARFFFRGDRKIPMTDWVEKLKKVLFQARLGTVYEKVVRVGRIGEYLAESVSDNPQLKSDVSRAALLCKADLVSQVVIEFTKLQGVMGRVYAQLAGEPETVAAAIEEHYRPTHSGGPLPNTMTGAILAVADKIDSICGCFSVGLIPTGASDPYALRRQGIGVLQIMHQKGFSASLRELIRVSVDLFADKRDTPAEETAEETIDAVYEFLKSRMTHILADGGYSKDVIQAVTEISIDRVPQVRERVAALEKLKSQPDFEPLAAAFKRVVNIIKKSDMVAAAESVRVDESLFQDPCESNLYRAFQEVENRVDQDLNQGGFEAALLDIASLKKPV